MTSFCWSLVTQGECTGDVGYESGMPEIPYGRTGPHNWSGPYSRGEERLPSGLERFFQVP